MQTILYNKQTKKIVKIFQDAEVIGNRIKHKNGVTVFGDGLDVVFVKNKTVKIKKIDEFNSEFVPNNITNLKAEISSQSVENKIETLKEEIEKLKEIIAKNI